MSNEKKFSKRVLSGVQPTGGLHLGNYLGAIKNFVPLQEKYKSLFCVVDLHAITVWQEPQDLVNNKCEVAAAFIASGICLLYTSPSPRDATLSRMPSSA